MDTPAMMPIRTIVPDDRHDQANELLERCSSGEEVRNIEGLRKAKDGQIFPVLLTLSLLRDDAGQSLAIASIAKDISDQKRAEEALKKQQDLLEQRVKERTQELEDEIGDRQRAEKGLRHSEERTRQIVETALDAVIAISEDSTIIRWNAQAETTFGYTAEEVIGSDLTEQKRINAELMEAKERAEDASRAKSVFLANVSHEIRTPMNAILGFTDILEQQIQDAGQKAHLSSIQESGRSLIALLADILDLTRIQSGGLVLQEAPTLTDKFLGDVEDGFRTQAEAKGLAFEVDLDPGTPRSIVVDEKMLRRILENLLDNALKFTKSGQVRVSVRSTPTEGSDGEIDLSFDVQDTGQGIPADQIEAVFEPFTQKKGQSINEFGGTGVGLALTRAFVSEMGGRVHVESEANVGSTFRVALDGVQVCEGSVDEDAVGDTTTDSVEEERVGSHVWTIADVDEETRAKLPDLLKRLQKISGTCEELAQTLTINDVEDFAESVVRLGEAYQLPPVVKWGQRLADQAAMFDMEAMPETLGTFGELINEVHEISAV